MSWENIDIEFEGANWRTKMNALFAQLEATDTGAVSYTHLVVRVVIGAKARVATFCFG